MKRIYFLVPDLALAGQIVDTLLLARIEERRLHVLGKRDRPLGDLPEAGFVHKTDVVPALLQGLVTGGGTGMLAGAVATALPTGSALGGGAVLVGLLLGGALGAWLSSMIGASVPNRHLAEYQDALDQGALLLMVDVPRARVAEIEALLLGRYPGVVCKGTDPSIPAFP